MLKCLCFYLLMLVSGGHGKLAEEKYTKVECLSNN